MQSLHARACTIVRRSSATRVRSAGANGVSRVATVASARCLPQQPAAPLRSLHAAVPVRLSSAAGTAAFNATSSSSAAAPAVPSSSSLPPVPLFQHLTSPEFLAREALVSGPDGRAFSYAQLLTAARAVQAQLQQQLGKVDLREERIAMLYPSGFSYVAALLGAWLSGAIAVPLHPAHPPPELEYLLADAGASVLLVDPSMATMAHALAKPPQPLDEREMRVIEWAPNESQAAQAAQAAKPIDYGNAEQFSQRRAMFIYTSGTTGKPKGVVWRHSMLEFQLSTLTREWQWSSSDRILNVLPLHHIHGVVNVLLSALYAGARCDFPRGAGGKANTEEIARALLETDPARKLTVFMAVPTIYSQLLTWVRQRSPEERARFKERCAAFRLMVSGSSALPGPVLDAWESEAGTLLLERYGMSETGMTLSQPIDLAKRHAMRGSVGTPLPGVITKIVPLDAEASDAEASPAALAAAAAASKKQQASSSADSNPSAAAASAGAGVEVVGELRVKGPGVFREYWRRPEKTDAEFDAEGWFKTGDVVSVTPATSPANTTGLDVYRMLGRASVDVLKSAGYKISALDVERELLSHPDIEGAAVVGVEDTTYGQIVAAVVQLKACSGCSSADQLQRWCRTRLASYQVPRLWRIVGSIPRNAMGKVNKKELVKMFHADNDKQ